ncbi:MAG: hypothetical protein CR994_02990 [Maribacter sp.]|nr:MAG: hypothetical protein CR994_02990 [Maribacter sp.]
MNPSKLFRLAGKLPFSALFLSFLTFVALPCNFSTEQKTSDSRLTPKSSNGPYISKSNKMETNRTA